MKKILPLALALVTLGASAQSLQFGKKRVPRQSRVEAVKQSQPKQVKVRSAKAKFIPIDEAQSRDDNGHIFRHVYGYDNNRQRSSEAIYCKEKQSDGSYVDKGLVVRGTYQYAYDTQDRLIQKSVDYGSENNDYGFYSYFVQVNYQADGKAVYVKNVKSDNSIPGYDLSEVWSYYPSGNLALYTTEGDSGDREYYALTEQGNVKEAGLLKGVDMSDFSLNLMKCRTVEGALNDSTITYYGRIYNSADTDTRDKTKVEHYKYSPTGLLLEYTVYGGSEGDRKIVYTYDNLGRIASLKEYYANDDDSDVGTTPMNVTRGMSEWDHSASEPAVEPEWQAEPEFCQTWTYLDNTTVWGIGNPWHDVFNLDGPTTEILLVDEGYTTRNTFEWTAPGKLAGYTYYNEDIDGETEDQKIEVDADGHIVKDVWTSKESYGGGYEESTESTTYVWEGDKLVSASEVDENTYASSEGSPYTNKTVTDYSYAFADNYFKKTSTQTYFQTDGVPSVQEPYTLTVTKKGNCVRSVNTKTNLDSPYITVVDVQDEDLTFTLPNILKDVEGFTADVPMVVSQKGRVVVATNQDNYGLGGGYNVSQADELYFNTMSDAYCTIEHDGDLTLGRDIEGLPLFVLKNGQVQKVYYYYGEDVPSEPSEALPSTQSLDLTVPKGKTYDEVTYTYNDAGQLVGQQIVEVESDGTRTETIKLEYKYDPTGIGHLEMDTRAGITLQGRMLNLKNGAAFSVVNMGGAVLADGVNAYTFQSPGIYLIRVGKQTIKVNVK